VVQESCIHVDPRHLQIHHLTSHLHQVAPTLSCDFAMVGKHMKCIVDGGKAEM
jgi:hypothetical protein